MRFNVFRVRYILFLSLLYLTLVGLLYRLLWGSSALTTLFDSPGMQAPLTSQEVPEFNLRRINPPHLPPAVLAELGDIGAAEGPVGVDTSREKTGDKSSLFPSPPPQERERATTGSVPVSPARPPRLHRNNSVQALSQKSTVSKRGSTPSSVEPRHSVGVASNPEPRREKSTPSKPPHSRSHPSAASGPSNHSADVKSTTSVKQCLHAFYYMWYGNVATDDRYFHWNHRYLPHWKKEVAKEYPQGRHAPPDDIGASFYPKLGCYSSRDLRLMASHMEQARDAGIGVLAVSWYPPGIADDEGFPPDPLLTPLLDVALSYGVKITIHIEPYPNRSPTSVVRDIQYIHRNYSSHPAFYKFRRRDESGTIRTLPLVYIYDSYLSPAKEWGRVFRKDGTHSIRGSDHNAVVIGLLVESSHTNSIVEGGFDGFYTYFASDGFTYGSNTKNWARLASFANNHRLLFIPSFGPGYDDVRVRPWNKKNTKTRQNGDYYQAMFGAALKHNRGRILSVTSFNEWHEGTQIEPAVPKGAESAGFTYLDYAPQSPEFYLHMTADFSDQMQCNAAGL